MWRSLQFIPASSEKMMHKADICEADAIIFDLEDSVALEEKKRARLSLRSFLEVFENKNRCGIVVRINPLDSFGKEDLKSLTVSEKIDAFMLPKADIENVKLLECLLSCFEVEQSYKDGKFKVIALIETAQGLWNAFQIGMASSRMKGMLFGAEDFLTQMGVERSAEGEEITVARHLHAIACKAAGVEAYDTPFTDTKNQEALAADILRAKKTGMTGKAAIHPSQAAIINSLFAPSAEEIEKARRIIEASKEAGKEGRGAFAVDGKMVDAPIIQRALNVLNLAGIKPEDF